MTTNKAEITRDTENKKLTVVRAFEAPLDKVWDAWTQSEILDQWWAPKPYKATTRHMDFREGGYWLYEMAGPKGDSQLSRSNYEAIEPQKSITTTDMFCDEQGNESKSFPHMHWVTSFSHSGSTTTVVTELTLDSAADMDAIIKSGFEEGYSMGLSNLEEYLDKQS